jgi:hypothetical protein
VSAPSAFYPSRRPRLCGLPLLLLRAEARTEGPEARLAVLLLLPVPGADASAALVQHGVHKEGRLLLSLLLVLGDTTERRRRVSDPGRRPLPVLAAAAAAPGAPKEGP